VTAKAVHALEDRCPHRGARLSLGWNSATAACWCPRRRSDGSGTAEGAGIGQLPDGRAQARQDYRSRRAGAIFLWFGIDPNAEPAPLELPEDLVSDEYSQFLCVSNWKCNYRYAIDNVMDPMHGA
jgi:phenylpropionate dioxygenase-like ring-hydroxylating dioxygenase large terminal subunit